MSVIDFLRDIGKHFTVPYMLAKDSVQARLAAGMSFTEFSYQTLQAADFLHLHREHGVDLQMGGADQWGNITAGLELIRRVEGRAEGADPSAFGLCSPLLLTRSGQKRGKSEKGAVFLDPTMTSPFDFYQYWINDDDALVIDHLRWLTTLDRDEIAAIATEHAARPEARPAQQVLARDLIARIHGPAEAEHQARLAEAAFAAEVTDPTVLAGLFEALEHFEFGSEADAWTALDVAVAAAGGSSRAEARRLVSQGGVSVNGQRLTDPAAALPALIAGRWWWVALGKRRRVVGRRRAD
jgi:tyrosyl-tRNA synthetase